jgi:hypothetical protein
MYTKMGRTQVRRGAQQARVFLAVASTVLWLGAQPAAANGLGENGSWQFQTSQDKVNKGAVLDLIERKKGGFYDSFKTTVNNNNITNIDKQFNCSVGATTTGNAGSNGMTASTSSPTTSNTGTTSSGTTANTASNGVGQNGFGGVLVAGAGGIGMPPQGVVDSNQANSGTLSSGISGSSTSATTGAISADGGRTDQALHSLQTNTGTQTASIQGSTACVGPLNGN